LVSVPEFSHILSPVVNRTLSDEVVERLRKAILNGHFAPGEQLREASLAERLGVSRGPVREALKRLEREGLVVVGRNRRTYTARLSLQDLEELYSLRSALEPLALRYACRRATPDDLAAMQAVVDTMAEYLARGITEQEAAELDLRFHELIYQASRHQRLFKFWTSLRHQIYIFLLSRNVADPDFRDQAVRGHQEILDAIKARDEERCVMIIEAHLQVGYDRARRSYKPAS